MKGKLFYYSFMLYMCLFPLVPSRLNRKYPITEIMLLIVLFFYLLYIVGSRDKLNILKNNLRIFFKESVSTLMVVIFFLMLISIIYCTSKLLVLKETLRFGIAMGLYFIIRFEFDIQYYKFRLLKLIYFPAIVVMIIGFIEGIVAISINQRPLTYRVESTSGNPNIYGGYLIVLFFPLLMLTIKEEHKRKKYFFIIELLSITYSIIITYSRNALLALVLGCLLMSLYYNRKLLYPFILSFVGIFFLPQVQARINSGDLGRFSIYAIAIKVFQDHPFIGVGIGNFEAVFKGYYLKYPQYQYDPLIYHTHNIYLKFLSELGIIGFAFFVLFLIQVLRVSVKAVKSSSGQLKNFCIGIVILNLVFWVISLFDNIVLLPKVMNFYFILIAISANVASKNKSSTIL
jgi:putative inorganic carbon (hco3(-)) transporter